MNGATIVDASGLGNDGTLFVTGMPTDRAVAGIASGAIDFDNVDDRVTVDLGSSLATGNSPFSIAGWINPDIVPTVQDYIFSFGNDSSGEFFSLTLENAGGTNEFRYRTYGGFLGFDASSVTVDSGWHHVAAVLPPGSTTVDDFQFYLDGSPMTEVVNTSNSVLNLQSTPLHIGDSSVSPQSFGGQIDDVQYYDHALSAADVGFLAANPGITVGEPNSAEFSTTFSQFETRTAEADGDSPANSSGFPNSGEFFVRERGDLSQTGQRTQAFLKFDLSALGDDEILSAELLLHQTDKLNSVNSSDLLIGRVLSEWDADGGTAPVFDDAVADEFVFGTNGPASAGPVVDILHEIDVTDIVKAWQADPDSNYGFRLALAGGFTGAAFTSAGGLAPRLVITQTQVIPEPASCVLLGLGVLALMAQARRLRRR